MARYQISDCHKTLREQWANGGYTNAVSEEEALESRFYKSALPWFEEGYASIAATEDKTPAIWSWAHWGTGGFSEFSHADLVFMARMFPNRASLTLLGSPVLPARRLVGVDIDSGSEDLLSWELGERGPALIVRSGRAGGGFHLYRRIGDGGHTHEDGQPSVNGKLGPDGAWTWTTHNKKGQPLPRAHWKSCIDVKSNGGYLVAPGSLHKSGTVYGVVGCEPGPITREQIRAIPALQGPITFRSGPTSDPATKTFGGKSGNHYEHVDADFGEAHWRHLDGLWAALKPGQHRAVACHLHDHSDPNGKPGTVYLHADGRKGYNCNGRCESYSEPAEVVAPAPVRKVLPLLRTAEETAGMESLMASMRYADLLTDADNRESVRLEAATLPDLDGWFESTFEEPETVVRDLTASPLLHMRLSPAQQFALPDVDAEAGEATERFRADSVQYGYCYDGHVSIVKPGTYSKLPCKKYTCQVCGQRQMAADRAAARVVLYRDGYRTWHAATATVTEDNRGSILAKMERWLAQPQALEDEDGTKEELPPIARLYLSVGLTPETDRLLLLWADGEEPPPFAHTRVPLAADAFDDAMLAVDMYAWKEHQGRVRITNGSYSLSKQIHALRDRVLGVNMNIDSETGKKMRGVGLITLQPKRDIEAYMQEYLEDPGFKYVKKQGPPTSIPKLHTDEESVSIRPVDAQIPAIEDGKKSGRLADFRDRFRSKEKVDYTDIEELGFDTPVLGRRNA